jgi:hypothetical protein
MGADGPVDGEQLIGHDELILIAELGAAFAGFLAIFLIFAKREGRFSPVDSLAVRSMILSSFSTIFIALVPLALALLGFSEPVVWRASSGFGLLAFALVGLNMGLAQRRIPADDRGDLSRGLVIGAWLMGSVAAVLLVANVSAVFAPSSAGLHIAALVVLLAITALNFSDIAFKRLI